MPTSRAFGARGISHALATLAIVALWALHWAHLGADFPNNSPWMDYSKYTDEGWYGNAAMRSTLFGHALLPGDFNPSVALPVWPALLWLVFQVAGVSPEAARGLALVVLAGNLLLSYAVLRAAGASRTAAQAGVLLLAGSAYLWAFSRLAILEPLLSFWTLVAWWLVLRLHRWRGRRRTLALLAVGLLGCLAVLTKTTAVFLLPATGVLLSFAAGWQPRRLQRDVGWAMLGGAVPWLAYVGWALHAHPLDYHYLFAANQWVRPPTLGGRMMAFWWAAHGLLWVGPPLVCAALLLLAMGAFFPSMRRSPLLWASLLAASGYIFFTGWHNNPQPRYYMVLLYPVVFVSVLGAETVVRHSRPLGAIAAFALLVLFVREVRQTWWYATHPQYSWQSAAQGLTAYINAHPLDGRRLLLSISGDEITLFTHLPALCDDFGTDDLPARIRRYRPAWYAQWNDLDPGTLEDIRDAGYKLLAVAHWHAFDDEDRDELILYRMLPLKN